MYWLGNRHCCIAKLLKASTAIPEGDVRLFLARKPPSLHLKTPKSTVEVDYLRVDAVVLLSLPS